MRREQGLGFGIRIYGSRVANRNNDLYYTSIGGYSMSLQQWVLTGLTLILGIATSSYVSEHLEQAWYSIESMLPILWATIIANVIMEFGHKHEEEDE